MSEFQDFSLVENKKNNFQNLSEKDIFNFKNKMSKNFILNQIN